MYRIKLLYIKKSCKDDVILLKGCFVFNYFFGTPFIRTPVVHHSPTPSTRTPFIQHPSHERDYHIYVFFVYFMILCVNEDGIFSIRIVLSLTTFICIINFRSQLQKLGGPCSRTSDGKNQTIIGWESYHPGTRS